MSICMHTQRKISPTVHLKLVGILSVGILSCTQIITTGYKNYVAKLHWLLFPHVNGLKRILVNGALYGGLPLLGCHAVRCHTRIAGELAIYRC